MYCLESDLVVDATSGILQKWAKDKIAINHEFDYQSGRVDIVGASSDGCVLAFEAKLSKWRSAIHQAYRSTSYANYVYVVLPAKTAKRAARFPEEFDRHGVGLIAVDSEDFEILIPSPEHTPIIPWLTDAVRAYVGTTSA